MALLLLVIAERAWVTEDAYISFRSVDNFVNGYGLRWNVDERVQAFTHPLWVLLHIPFYWLTREVFFTTIAISLVTSLAAFRIGMGAPRHPLLVLVLLVPLVSSKAFTEYATSGLETPATLLFLALFARAFLDRDRGASLGRLAFLAALGATNRLDCILFYLPALAFAARRDPGPRRLRQLALGLLPLVAWEAFSLFYYGFLFPNTKYAKLDTGLPRGGYLRQGFVYALDLLMNDPVSAGAILIGAALALRSWRRASQPALLAAGLALYAAYVVWAGGDFMSGRFWSPCVFLGALLAYDAVRRECSGLGTAGWATVLLLIGLLPLLHPPSLFFRTRANKFGTLVMDEREYYADTNTLLNYSTARRAIHHAFSQEGLRIRKLARSGSAAGKPTTWITALVGMFGFHAGPEVIVIDRIGLGDPLLARLPLEDLSKFPRPGHFIRGVPEGYEEARRSGSLAGMDPSLAAYYAPLREIVSGPLLSPHRLATIVAFNLGRYDHFRDAYVASRPARAEAEPKPGGDGAGDAKPR